MPTTQSLSARLVWMRLAKLNEFERIRIPRNGMQEAAGSSSGGLRAGLAASGCGKEFGLGSSRLWRFGRCSNHDICGEEEAKVEEAYRRSDRLASQTLRHQRY